MQVARMPKAAYKGRPEDTGRNKAIVDMLVNGQSWNSIGLLRAAHAQH
jgi:hypothetical protein